MKRGGPLARRTRLTAKTGLGGGGEPKRRASLRPVSKKRQAENRQRAKVVEATFSEHPVCAVPWCRRFADDVHEPLTRGRGGSITDPANMEPLCRPCHDVITDTEPAWAYDLGLLRHSWDRGDAA